MPDAKPSWTLGGKGGNLPTKTSKSLLMYGNYPPNLPNLVPIHSQHYRQRKSIVAGGGFETRPPERPPI